MTFKVYGKRQKLKFFTTSFSRLYTKVKIFAFTGIRDFFIIFYWVDLRIIEKVSKIRVLSLP